ncbi:Fe-S cluster assembly sulfur transfer protein SufU [Erysipelothrix urinaevulpis]|uniref:Fe-S cluster assembly sulfur transfer protein SufU n=1 Tax=Erysipelothrix urinaevulpis TaxID=2683717 RepID=UPI001357F43F|nr:SUF system NifU family Fe-S cluster assembly protein [Erysipelothrix urinaevulpis]
MNYFDDPLFLRQIIMDHYENPRNKRTPDKIEEYRMKHMKTDSCIDDITVYVKVKENRIVDLCFIGSACTISTASTSIMTELLKNKTLEEASQIIKEFDKMMRLETFDVNMMQEANAFKNVGRQANRIACARLGWQGVQIALKGVLDYDNE